MFSRLRVLELASVLAGPSVGQFLAELGAEVIKVENPLIGGDVTRSWKITGEETDDRSAYFCCCNWGKKSIALDLSKDDDRKKVLKLAGLSDIILVSYKPGDAEKLGVGYEQIKAGQPSIIYGQITGYGSDDHRVGYDAVIQAESGFMDLNGEKSGPPTKMPVALIDVLAAHQLKEALLLALLKKEKTGQGSFVEVSLMDAAIASLMNQATNWLVAGQVPSRQGSAHPNIAPYGETFITKDNQRVMLAIGSDRQFQMLLTVLRLSTKDFGTNQRRIENRGMLHDLLSSAIKELDSGDLITRLNSKKIPAGVVRNVRDALDASILESLGLTSQSIKGLRTFVASGFDTPEMLPPPHLGEHTKEILRLISE